MSEQVKIVLAVDAQQVEAGSARAAKALSDVEKAAQKAGTGSAAAGKQASEGLGKQKDAADKVGPSLLTLGALSLAAAGGTVVAAAKWESAYAGVRKTVSGTADQMKNLEEGLRGITKVASASHTEVAGVAEAAGQLGVARKDVAGFTKVMVDLGVATNLTAEEGAVAIRQFMNIMGSAPDSVERIGSAIVGLGNNSATTERDIVAMAQRLAGAGKQARMSESEVLAMAAAMASVGIEAEAGGTAMSLTLKQIDAMVRGGGPKLELLGKIAGTSGQEFATAWGTSAAGATDTLVKGLGRMSASGEDVNAILAQLGFEGLRQTDTLLRLSGATQAMGGEVDLLSNALKLSAEEFEKNNALQIEAETRYGTTAEKAKIAANQLNDGLIDIGNALLPIANDGIQVVSDLATAFSSLPDPVKGALGGIAALAGVIALGAGGALKAATAFQTAKAAVAALGVSMRTASLAGGAIGLALAGVALLIGQFASSAASARQFQDDLRDALRETNGELRDQNGLFHDAVQRVAAKRAQDEGLLQLAEKYKVAATDVTAAMLGDVDARKRVTSAMDEHVTKANDLAVAQQNAGKSWIDEMNRLDDARGARDRFNAVLGDSGKATDETVRKEQQLLEATGAGTDATKQSAAAAQAAAQAKADLAAASQEAEQELRAYIKALYAESDAQMAALTGTLNVNSAMLDAADRAKEWKKETEKAGTSAATAFDQSTRAGIRNNETMLRAIQASKDDIQAKIEQGTSTEELLKLQSAHRNSLVATAKQFGVTEKDAESYINRLFATPNSIETIAALQAAAAQTKLAEWKGRLDALPAEEVTAIRALLDQGQVAAAEAKLNEAARNRTSTITTVIKVGSAIGYTGRYPGGTTSAGGDLFEFYSRGGLNRVGDVRNAHAPALVPAGTWRTFAEDETGGEAYIPLRNDWRRSRAVSILGEVADRFGLSLVKDATQFALGGLTAQSYNTIRRYQTGILPVAEFAKLNAELTRTAAILRQTAGAAASTAKSQQQATAARVKAEAALKTARDTSSTSTIGKAQTALKAARDTSSTSAVGKAQAALKIAKAKPAKTKAQKAARAHAVTASEKALDAARKKQEAAIKAAEKAVENAKKQQESNIVAAQKVVAKTKAAEAKAAEVNKAAQDKARDAAKAQEQATKDLAASHKQLADSARQAADQLRQTYMVGGDAADLLSSMQQGTGNLGQFAALVEQLRKAGLNENLVQQIIDQGAVWGAETAKDILKGGKPTVDALNKAASALQEAADKLGLLTVVGQKQYASGGIEVHKATIGTGIRRVWDEPETGGESYIPLASSKRSTSIPIWQRTGELLGVTKPTVALAGGGILTGATIAAPSTQGQSITHNNYYSVRLPESIKDMAQMVAFFDQAPLNLHRTGG